MTTYNKIMQNTTGNILIFTNGSYQPLSGKEQASIEELIEVLSKNTLDPSFERFGCFANKLYSPVSGKTDTNAPWYNESAYFGNFHNLSHAFNIVIKKEHTLNDILEKAFSDNLNSERYQRLSYEAYKDHLIVKDINGGFSLQSEQEFADITKSGFSRRYQSKTYRLVGPRFSNEEKERFYNQLCK